MRESERDEGKGKQERERDRWVSEWVREKGRLKKRERDEESMRIRKERKRDKRDRNSNIFGIVRKISLGRKWERKGS